jgi:hypothetical protein
MRISKYLIAVWTAIAVYTLFSFLSGPMGISAFNYLLSERDIQRANINELGLINEELERTRNNLLYDHDTLLVHARQMGYGHENERFVRIVGLGNFKTAPAVTGNVYSAQNPEFIPEKTIKIAALLAGLLVFAFLLMLQVVVKEK